MKEPAATSPFAAMSRQEQRHQWNVWHAQQSSAPTVELPRAQTPPVRSLPKEEEAQEQAKPQESVPETPRDTQPQPRSAPVMATPKPHYGQYQAVLKRMEQAGRHTSAFASANPPSTAAMRTAAPLSAPIAPENSTVQPESGSE